MDDGYCLQGKAFQRADGHKPSLFCPGKRPQKASGMQTQIEVLLQWKTSNDFMLLSCLIGPASETFRSYLISAQSPADVRATDELQKGEVFRR